MKILTRLIASFLLLAAFMQALHGAPITNTRDTADLVLLARVWGYLKYFAPGISQRNVDWDKVLVTQLQYLDENPGAGIGHSIRTMMDSAAAVAPSGKKAGALQLAGAKSFEKINIDHSWIMKSPRLSAADKQRLTALADYFVPFPNKYIETPDVTGRPSPVFKEDTYTADYLPEKNYRLLALFRYWNIIEYYLPAKYQQKGTWPQTLARFIPEFTEANTNRKYALALVKLNAAITDGHSVMPNVGKYPETVLSGRLIRVPFTTGVVDDTVVVMHTDSGFAERSGIHKGSRILAVNGVPVRRLVDSLTAWMSDPREVMKQYYITRSGMLSLVLAKGDSLAVTFESAGKPKTFAMQYGNKEMMDYLQVAGRAWRAQAELAKQRPADPAMRMLEGDILLIDPSKWTGTMADSTRRLLSKAKALIIECRTYPNFDFINFSDILFENKTTCILWNGSVSYPGLTRAVAYSRGPDPEMHFKGPVIALISERSLSRPEMLTMIVKARGGNTKLIGRTTAGADGDVTQIPMVGNQSMRFVISGLGVLYPDGGYTQGVGIAPDIEVPNSIDELISEKDVILDRALQYLGTLR